MILKKAILIYLVDEYNLSTIYDLILLRIIKHGNKAILFLLYNYQLKCSIFLYRISSFLYGIRFSFSFSILLRIPIFQIFLIYDISSTKPRLFKILIAILSALESSIHDLIVLRKQNHHDEFESVKRDVPIISCIFSSSRLVLRNCMLNYRRTD